MPGAGRAGLGARPHPEAVCLAAGQLQPRHERHPGVALQRRPRRLRRQARVADVRHLRQEGGEAARRDWARVRARALCEGALMLPITRAAGPVSGCAAPRRRDPAATTRNGRAGSGAGRGSCCASCRQPPVALAGDPPGSRRRRPPCPAPPRPRLPVGRVGGFGARPGAMRRRFRTAAAAGLCAMRGTPTRRPRFDRWPHSPGRARSTRPSPSPVGGARPCACVQTCRHAHRSRSRRRAARRPRPRAAPAARPRPQAPASRTRRRSWSAPAPGARGGGGAGAASAGM